MPLWSVFALVIAGVTVIVLPLYLRWWTWWDRRMQGQADRLFPGGDEEQQRATWQLLRALEGPRLRWRLKLDLSDIYARRHGKKP